MKVLITFDGYDRTGKTSLAGALTEAINSNDKIPYDALYTREPFYGFCEGKTKDEQAQFYTKDREKHIQEVINPALENSTIVVCDRFYLSTFLYQEQFIFPDFLSYGTDIYQYVTHCSEKLIRERLDEDTKDNIKKILNISKLISKEEISLDNWHVGLDEDILVREEVCGMYKKILEGYVLQAFEIANIHLRNPKLLDTENYDINYHVKNIYQEIHRNTKSAYF